MEQVIVDMAHRLGLAAERVWPQVVMVTWVKGLIFSVVDAVLLVACLVGLAVLIRMCSRERARPKADMTDDGLGTYLICGLLIFVLAGIAFLAMADWPNAITAVLYPEAVTVINMAKAVKQ